MPESAEKLQPALLHVGIAERTGTEEARMNLPGRCVRYRGVSGEMLGDDGDVLSVSSFSQNQGDVKANDASTMER